MIYRHHSNGQTGDLNDLDLVIRATTKALRPHLDAFDAIAVTGVSGLIVGPTVAIRLKKRLVVFRKDDDTSTHSTRREYGVRRLSGQRVLILDDTVDSGKTVDTLAAKITAQSAAAVGLVLYDHTDDNYKVAPTVTLGEHVPGGYFVTDDPRETQTRRLEIPF